MDDSDSDTTLTFLAKNPVDVVTQMISGKASFTQQELKQFRLKQQTKRPAETQSGGVDQIKKRKNLPRPGKENRDPDTSNRVFQSPSPSNSYRNETGRTSVPGSGSRPLSSTPNSIVAAKRSSSEAALNEYAISPVSGK